MDELKKVEQAKAIFKTLCQAMDNVELRYQKDEEKLTIAYRVSGDDLPMDVTVKVDAERRLVILFSNIPFKTPEDKRLDVAVAVSVINNKLVDGSFDYNITSGHMIFRMTNSYIESKLGEDIFMYMLGVSINTIDEYNDKFMMLGKGMITLEQFLSSTAN